MKTVKIYSTIVLFFCYSIGFAQSKIFQNKPIQDTVKTYSNPIIHADYSDPDVIRVGEDYFMTASSFNCVPGLPILHSKDLVNWQLVNYALPKLLPEEVYDSPQHGKGVWAPCIRFHQQTFYIYYPDPDFGIYMTQTLDPFGKWSEPVLVKKGKGLIDPSPLWDEDGKVYLTYALAGSRAGMKSLLLVCTMNSAGTIANADDVMVFDGHDKHPTVEGPKFYKKDDYYYIFAPAGGVKTGWQLVLRSKFIYGPYEERIVLEQGETKINGPHQGAWVDTHMGEHWFIHFQDLDAYGRIVHLQPMKWIDDWPVMGVESDKNGIGNPVSIFKIPKTEKSSLDSSIPTSDEFNLPKLGLQWQWHANTQVYWGYPTNEGYYNLICRPKPIHARNLWQIPNLLLQKFPAESFSVTSKITFKFRQNGENAGLLIMGKDYSYLQVKQVDTQRYISQVICKDAPLGNLEKTVSETQINSSIIYLRVNVDKGGICQFSYSEDYIKFIPIGEAFIAKEGLWIGAKVGLFALSENPTNDAGSVQIDWFRFD